jgi:hypothetical protein
VGTLAHCYLNGSCFTSLDSELKYPNGIVKPAGNQLFIANSAKGFVSSHVMAPFRSLFLNHSINAPRIITPDHHPIKIGMPIDNLSADSKGHIFVAGFPDMLGVLKAMRNADKETNVASTVFRIRRILVRDEKIEKEFGLEPGRGNRVENIVEKVIEDREGKVLPAASTAVHDVKTGNLWLSGFASKFITVCEPKPW